MDPWGMPKEAEIGGRKYPVYTDFRDVLEVIKTLQDPEYPEWMRWPVALRLFYQDKIPPECQQEAADWMAEFISAGEQEPEHTQRKAPIIDWEQDAAIIVSDINKVAGCEIRALPYLHWWSFIAYFRGIGEGQLSTVVSIRSKIRRGKPLEKWEKEFYSENRSRIDLKPRYTTEELEEQRRLKEILGE